MAKMSKKMAFKKMEKADMSKDKKMGIKENSKRDAAMDAKAMKPFMKKGKK